MRNLLLPLGFLGLVGTAAALAIACGGSSSNSEASGEGGVGDEGSSGDGAAALSGLMGTSGGTYDTLSFAVIGDTRPPNEDDVSGYPTPIITKIFQDIEAYSPHPPFVLATGDYQYAAPNSSGTSGQQIDLYMGARKGYSGALYPAMGNHECTGATDGNCGTGNQHGVTPNMQDYLTQMLGPIGQTKPYYSIDVAANDGSWTAKFVITAANAWDSGQQSWLSSVMAQPTTYTFVVRHESSETTGGPPGESGVDSVIKQYPYTMLIVGHSHTYEHNSYNTHEVIIGNGGAPLSSKNYGFGIFAQRSDGAIVVDMIDYQSLQADSSFHFVVKPDGTMTQ